PPARAGHRDLRHGRRGDGRPRLVAPAVMSPAPDSDKEPLSPGLRIAILSAVVFFHVGAGWALTQIHPNRLVVGEASPLEVRIVPARVTSGDVAATTPS